MVRLTEVEDEYFKEKSKATKNDALLASDDEDDDFTDTGKRSHSLLEICFTCQLSTELFWSGAGRRNFCILLPSEPSPSRAAVQIRGP